MFSKTQHDSAAAAVADALDDSAENDCAELEFDTGERRFTVQFLDPDDDGRHRSHNVTGFGEDPGKDGVAAAVDRTVVDEGSNFVIVHSHAETVDGVLAEVDQIASAFEADRGDIDEVRAFPSSKPSFLGNLKSLLGWV